MIGPFEDPDFIAAESYYLSAPELEWDDPDAEDDGAFWDEEAA